MATPKKTPKPSLERVLNAKLAAAEKQFKKAMHKALDVEFQRYLAAKDKAWMSYKKAKWGW